MSNAKILTQRAQMRKGAQYVCRFFNSIFCAFAAKAAVENAIWRFYPPQMVHPHFFKKQDGIP